MSETLQTTQPPTSWGVRDSRTRTTTVIFGGIPYADLSAAHRVKIVADARTCSGLCGKPNPQQVEASKGHFSDVPKEAHLYVRGDDSFQAFVNGQAVPLKAAPGAGGWSLLSAPVAELLRPGANFLSVGCRNSVGPAGFVAILETGESGKRSYLATDESWRVREERPAGWPSLIPAHWIWTTKVDAQQTCYFERVVEIADAPTFAFIYACGDNAASVFINGSPVSFAPAAHAWWVRSANVTNLLRQGKNVIAVECYNEGGPGGLIALLNVKAGGKWTQVVTDSSRRVSDAKPANFPHESPSHKWQNATVLGPAGMQPWGFVGGYPAPYLPTPAADLDARTQVELGALRKICRSPPRRSCSRRM